MTMFINTTDVQGNIEAKGNERTCQPNFNRNSLINSITF